MKKDLWAVVCGNIRDELDFKLTISKLIQLRAENKIQHILLSTWRGEIDKYENLRYSLKKLDVYILESYPISDDLQSAATDAVNFWRQSRQLLGALDLIPKDSFILRLRTDRSLNYINQMEKMGVFEEYAIETITFGNFPKVFQYKLFVFAPKMVRLMHMIDFVFLGYHKDLYKIINFDVNELMFQKQIVANAQWFMKPFIQEFPILRDYMRFTIFKNTIQLLKEYVDKEQDESIFPDVYYKVYAVYILIMHTHFKILYLGRVNDELLSNTGFYHFFTTSPGNNLYSTGLGTSIRNENVLTFAVEGKLKPSKSYSFFMNHIKNLKKYGNTVEFEYSYNDMLNLEEFVDSDVYTNKNKLKWYKALKTKPMIVTKKYKDKYELDSLNCIECDEDVWDKLCDTFSIEKDLWNKWFEIYYPKNLTTEKMLLPVAKTGNEYSIYILLDLLVCNKISEINVEEIIRIVEFYLNISITKKTNTDYTTRIAFKYFQLVDLSIIKNPKINSNELISCVLSIHSDLLDSEYLSDLSCIEKILEHDISDKYKYLYNSILIDIGKVSRINLQDILKYYFENNLLIDYKMVLKEYVS